MPFDLWLTFVAATIALLLIPGPTVLLVLSYALSKGRSVAVASAAGVALGDLVAMSASLLGLGALVLASATLFSLLKWVGAAYLIYLGVKLLRSAPTAGLELPDADTISASRVFGHTAAVTALNPKSIAFFIAFVPQFVRPEAALLPQFSILIVTFVTLAAANAFAYALAASRLRRVISRPGIITWITRAGGGALVAMGVLTATLRRGTA
ncbi:threonine/homoserine/homoserine lactone efflux protein [Sulfitobacter undariae]|uniref:Threonine/homoserine/homoserine lactone efflux protein n=1 Tax=Sulfitobacter undariae TaxID=1563671 RepID=A0A7W6GZS5_9RHOB|nr:LysE family translocator [Sulfitobacter undariae]MBB3992898.1 threonine/homoserine/homoserine lactone efflux protein [Sulfitobacter undariae]